MWCETGHQGHVLFWHYVAHCLLLLNFQLGPAGSECAGVAKLTVQEAGTDPQKRIRNLKKKLTQIQQLQDKLKGGATLDAEQQTKLDSEAEVKAELDALQGSK